MIADILKLDDLLTDIQKFAVFIVKRAKVNEIHIVSPFTAF